MDFDLLNAVSVLEDPKGIIALPGPEGYALAARTDHPKALARIARICGKNRDVLLLGRDIAAFSPFIESLPDAARALMARYWPGSLIILLSKNALASDTLIPGPFARLMQPEAPLLLDLLSLIPGGILAATFSGRLGEPAPMSAQAVFNTFGDDVDYVLPQDEDILESGVPTVVSVDRHGTIHLLRSGRIVLD